MYFCMSDFCRVVEVHVQTFWHASSLVSWCRHCSGFSGSVNVRRTAVGCWSTCLFQGSPACRCLQMGVALASDAGTTLNLRHHVSAGASTCTACTLAHSHPSSSRRQRPWWRLHACKQRPRKDFKNGIHPGRYTKSGKGALRCRRNLMSERECVGSLGSQKVALHASLEARIQEGLRL